VKFSEYHIDKRIKERLAALQFNRPTDIQYKSIFPILKGEDVFAVAPTGTGKTAAFVIPVLDAILKDKKRKGIACLCMVPTRELAEQIANVFNELSEGTDVSAFALFGGVSQDRQIQKLNAGVDVLITTPGRMFDLISQGHLDVSHVKTLVLDEADLMLDLGFKKDVLDVLHRLPKNKQTLFFSATINKKVKALAYNVGKDAIRIQISPKTTVTRSVEHVVAFIEMDDKRFFLENIIKENEESRVLVFVRTRVRAERVVKAMERVGLEAVFIHGDVDQKERFSILDSFKKGDQKVLVTTDVAARGIDIPNVEIVVNYDIPDNAENYVHRCGRTGRGNNTGFAISFCSEDERELVQAIEEYTGEQITRYELSKGEYEQIKWDTEDKSNDWKSLLDEGEEW
jgi:ATP-dependent RNA helicase RhlE